jgi:hypothetical protein
MPGTGSRDSHRFAGKESETPVTRSFLTKLGRSAGRELNQHPERGPVGGDRDISSQSPRERAVSRHGEEILAD